MATPDAWDDDWENAVDKPSSPTKKKITKAQRRAQQAEFNRQLWQEAEGPREPNYFLETRGIVPKADFKPPPRLLSRKAPNAASEPNGDDPSDDDDDDDGHGKKKKKLTIEEQRALVAKEREEKQRKYEERRLELFGSTSTPTPTPTATATTATTTSASTKPASSTSSPLETPPGTRSATPNRPRGRGGAATGTGIGGRKTNDYSRPVSSAPSSLSLKASGGIAPPSAPGSKKELFDPNFTPRPPESGFRKPEPRAGDAVVVEPIRSPRGPDGSGRGGFGFAPRGR